MANASQITIRASHSESYTKISNQILQNAIGLPIEARVILLDLLSRPKNWEVSIEHLCKTHGLGRDRCYRALGELRAAGFARLDTPRDPKMGHVGKRRWFIFEEPEDRFTENQESGSTGFRKSPVSGNHRFPENQDAYKGKNNIQTKDPLTKAAAPTAGPCEGDGLPSDGRDTGKAGASPPDDGFARFEASWRPWSQSDTREAALRAWRKLKPNEREEAANNAAIFVAGQACLRHPKWAATYLSDRLWRYRPSGGSASAPTTPPPTTGASTTGASRTMAERQSDGRWKLRHDSPQLLAWRDYERRTRPDGRALSTLYRPAEWPPAHAAGRPQAGVVGAPCRGSSPSQTYAV